jgi:hypothetical protein
MKHLQLSAAVLASACAMTAMAAQRNQTVYILHDTAGSHLQAGDVLVADGHGAAALYRGNAFVHMVQDPEDLVASRSSASQPLFITNAEGEVVRGNLADFEGDLFLSASAPEHIFHSKEFIDSKVHDAGGHGGGGSPLMTFHGGNVLVTPTTYSIFWGTSSSDITSGMASFFSGFSGSSIAAASKEYTGTNGQVSGKTSVGTVYQDNSTPPSKALSTSGAVAEVCKITNNAPNSNAVYFIFTSTGAGHVNYCAWHSWGSCGSTPIQVAYMPSLSGVSGCDPGDTVTGHSAALAALANVTSHELSEAITDPQGTGWFDSSGAENGDKCAWAFLSEPAPEPVSFGGSKWVLQGEWSNAAYNAGTGYLNRSGQPGCLY